MSNPNLCDSCKYKWCLKHIVAKVFQIAHLFKDTRCYEWNGK